MGSEREMDDADDQEIDWEEPVEPPSPCPVAPGDVLAGKYHVEGVLASGGIGIVVAARQAELDRRVAIKFLLPQALARPDLVNRFAREARTASKIRSEHVVRVLDVGTLENGAPYLVMEYLEGKDLAQLLKESGPLPLGLAVNYVLQACEALAEAHALGIVHRDVKPANLFVTRRADGSPFIKVLDFGISKLPPGDESGELTSTAEVLGSPVYMAPEQITSARSVDARADVWALGLLLYKLTTGRNAFGAPSRAEIMVKVLRDPTPSIAAVRPEIPPGLDAVVARCLEKEREARFKDVAELTQALMAFASRSGISTIERVARVLATPRGSSPSVAPSRPSRAPSRPSSASSPIIGSQFPPPSDAALGGGIASAIGETTSAANRMSPAMIAIAVAIAATAAGMVIVLANVSLVDKRALSPGPIATLSSSPMPTNPPLVPPSAPPAASAVVDSTAAPVNSVVDSPAPTSSAPPSVAAAPPTPLTSPTPPTPVPPTKVAAAAAVPAPPASAPAKRKYVDRDYGGRK